MLKAMPIMLSLVAACFNGVASAQDSPRFQMERANGGFMVMDTHTGITSFCREATEGFVCAATREEKATDTDTDTDIASLRKQITELQARVETLESGNATALELPSETEFEQTLNFMERFFRRFVDIVKGLDTEGTPKEEVAPSGRT